LEVIGALKNAEPLVARLVICCKLPDTIEERMDCLMRAGDPLIISRDSTSSVLNVKMEVNVVSERSTFNTAWPPAFCAIQNKLSLFKVINRALLNVVDMVKPVRESDRVSLVARSTLMIAGTPLDVTNA